MNRLVEDAGEANRRRRNGQRSRILTDALDHRDVATSLTDKIDIVQPERL